MFGGEERRVFAASYALDCDSDLPDDPVLFVREILLVNRSRSRVVGRPVAVRKLWRAHAAFDMDSPPGEVITLA
jgi:hypothetical protein